MRTLYNLWVFVDVNENCTVKVFLFLSKIFGMAA